MSEEGIKSSWVCPVCGRESRPLEPRCWFCAAPRPGATEVAAAAGPLRRLHVEPDEDYPRPSPLYWKLPNLTARMIVAACLPLGLAYGVGFAVLIALAPALRRLFRISRERLSEITIPPPTATRAQSIATIFAAIGTAALVVVSSLITFVAVCGPTGAYAMLGMQDEPDPVRAAVWLAGLGGGMAAAGGLGYGIIAMLFCRKKDEGDAPPWRRP
jgi:hypothetical protein